MLTPILPDLAPRLATSHVANQSALGADSPAGESGTAGLGAVGAAAQASPQKQRSRGFLFALIGEAHPNALSRLDRLDGVGGDAA